MLVPLTVSVWRFNTRLKNKKQNKKQSNKQQQKTTQNVPLFPKKTHLLRELSLLLGQFSALGARLRPQRLVAGVGAQQLVVQVCGLRHSAQVHQVHARGVQVVDEQLVVVDDLLGRLGGFT